MVDYANISIDNVNKAISDLDRSVAGRLESFMSSSVLPEIG